jgi:hypothetical protein
VIRVALAVLLAVALLGTAMPAIEDARVSTTERQLRADLSRVATVAESLAARHDAVPPGPGSARRTVRLVVPEAGWGRAAATVGVGSGPDGGRLVWAVADGPRHVARVDVDVRVWRDGKPMTGELRLGPGRHRLVMSLVRIGGHPTVVVSVRGLKSDTGRTSPRVRFRRRGGRGVSV